MNVKLESGSDGPMVVMPLEGGQSSHEPFAFPLLPWSTMNWLGALGGRVWDQHEVCCALLLLINPAKQSWGVTVPPQKSRADGVSWQMADAVPMGNTPETPLYIGGTYQMAKAYDPEQAIGLVPKTDGLHLVHAVDMQPAGAWTFLRVGGELSLRHAGEFVFDDIGARIDQVMRALGLPQ